MLVRLLYVSRAQQALTAADIESIMTQSRTHNPALGLTGLLCHSGQFFMQVLEGDRATVNALYSKLVRDDRHQNVSLLYYEEIQTRRFASWTMGLVNLARVNPSLILKYSPTATFDPYLISGSACMALLEELMATASLVGRQN